MSLGTRIKLLYNARLLCRTYGHVFPLHHNPRRNVLLLLLLLSYGRGQRRARKRLLDLAGMPGIDSELRYSLLALHAASWGWAKAVYGELGM